MRRLLACAFHCGLVMLTGCVNITPSLVTHSVPAVFVSAVDIDGTGTIAPDTVDNNGHPVVCPDTKNCAFPFFVTPNTRVGIIGHVVDPVNGIKRVTLRASTNEKVYYWLQGGNTIGADGKTPARFDFIGRLTQETLHPGLPGEFNVQQPIDFRMQENVFISVDVTAENFFGDVVHFIAVLQTVSIPRPHLTVVPSTIDLNVPNQSANLDINGNSSETVITRTGLSCTLTPTDEQFPLPKLVRPACSTRYSASSTMPFPVSSVRFPGPTSADPIVAVANPTVDTAPAILTVIPLAPPPPPPATTGTLGLRFSITPGSPSGTLSDFLMEVKFTGQRVGGNPPGATSSASFQKVLSRNVTPDFQTNFDAAALDLTPGDWALQAAISDNGVSRAFSIVNCTVSVVAGKNGTVLFNEDALVSGAQKCQIFSF